MPEHFSRYLAMGILESPWWATTPTIDAQHRVIQKPGYDSQSRILLDFEEGAFPPIDERPSKESSEKALADIRYLLSGFPFVDEAAE